MKKSVYSLVLSDGVIAEVDKAAYAVNTSRSNLINQILAEYVSYVTPEKKRKEIFKQVEDLLGRMQEFQLVMQPSETMLSLRSALAYKYNPTVRYSIELYKSRPFASRDPIGELRVSLRTQNASLILYMMQFFQLWVRIETAYTGEMDYLIQDGKYLRKLYLAEEQTAISQATMEQKLGMLIANYIQALDSAMKSFFSYLEDPERAAREVERRYQSYLKKHKERIL